MAISRPQKKYLSIHLPPLLPGLGGSGLEQQEDAQGTGQGGGRAGAGLWRTCTVKEKIIFQ